MVVINLLLPVSSTFVHIKFLPPCHSFSSSRSSDSMCFYVGYYHGCNCSKSIFYNLNFVKTESKWKSLFISRTDEILFGKHVSKLFEFWREKIIHSNRNSRLLFLFLFFKGLITEITLPKKPEDEEKCKLCAQMKIDLITRTVPELLSFNISKM